MKRRFYLPAGAAGMVLLVLGALGAVALASPPSGVTPTVLARGTFDAFKVRSYPQGRGIVHRLAQPSGPGVHHGHAGSSHVL